MVDGKEGKGADAGNGQERLFNAGEEGRPSTGEGIDREAAQRNSEEGSRQAMGFVYFIETEDGQYVKIGYSTKVMQRLGQLGTIMPVRLLGCFPGTRQTEGYLHGKFAGDREMGEWFRPSDELRQFIASTAMPLSEVTRRCQPVAEVIPKNPVAQALVALRNKKLSPAKRKAIAKKAAAARWEGHDAKRPASARKKAKK